MSVGERLGHRARKTWWRLRRPQTRDARVILAGADGTVCLVRHSYTSGWYLPGGGLRRREDPKTGARREALEELGVKVELTGLVGKYTSTAEGKRDTIWVFSATSQDQPRPSSPEVAAFSWFAADQLPPEVSPATRRRVEEWAGRRLVQGQW